MKPAARDQLLAKIYTVSQANSERALLFLKALLSGFWLGVLNRRSLHLIDKIYYDRNSKMYCDDEYNNSGLKTWERAAVNSFFADCKLLLGLGIGGGREVAALQKLGYEIDGFECHPELLDYAKQFLTARQLSPSVCLVPRDQCIATGRSYDGLIIGWGAYMLIQGRTRRVALLKALRAQTAGEGSPLLISFYSRRRDSKYFKTVARTGNALRWMLRKEYLDLGDDLTPNYVHFFNRQQIAAELEEAGFSLKFYSDQPYGHAVGVVANWSSPETAERKAARRSAPEKPASAAAQVMSVRSR